MSCRQGWILEIRLACTLVYKVGRGVSVGSGLGRKKEIRQSFPLLSNSVLIGLAMKCPSLCAVHKLEVAEFIKIGPAISKVCLWLISRKDSSVTDMSPRNPCIKKNKKEKEKTVLEWKSNKCFHLRTNDTRSQRKRRRCYVIFS